MNDDKNSVDGFKFSFETGRTNKHNLEMQINGLETRVNYLVNNSKINTENGPIAVLGHIIGISHDPQELAVLGKALIKVAEIIPMLDNLQKRKTIIDVANENPEWLAATFGDFTEDVELFTQRIDIED